MPKDYSKFENALRKAHAAAREATAKEKDYPQRLDCGMAWVVTHDRAFNGWCRKMAEIYRAKSEGARIDKDLIRAQALLEKVKEYGDKNWSTGWCFWKPGNFVGQSITGHEAGARAFRDVILRELGINAEVGSRFD